jgi:hypothetical protein
MPAVSEPARADAENFQVQSAAPLARATTILLAGGALPASLIAEVAEDGGPWAVTQLVQLAARHRRG